MQCPVCKDQQLLMHTRQDIEIDYCPKCRGVWLDRGELDKIIERGQREADTTPPASNAAADAMGDGWRGDHGRGSGGHHGEFGHGGSRHGSFLKRLFD